MLRLIAFILCIAFLVGAGVSVRAGMVIAALAVAALAVYVAWCFVAMFLSPRKK